MDFHATQAATPVRAVEGKVVAEEDMEAVAEVQVVTTVAEMVTYPEIVPIVLLEGAAVEAAAIAITAENQDTLRENVQKLDLAVMGVDREIVTETDLCLFPLFVLFN